jgi:uncharacterized protein YsxB (DUF464 family)
MISAEFSLKNDLFCGLKICGHAGYSHAGKDIVCASVSSCVMLTANLITDYFHISADISSDDNTIVIDCSSFEGDKLATCDCLLRGLYDHLNMIKEEFPRYIKINPSEV